MDPSRVKVGDRVGVSWVRDACRSCELCLVDETRCIEQTHSGRAVNGTLGQYTVVPFGYMIRLPEGPPDELLAPILCAGVTAYKSLKICGTTPGQWVAIIGAGGGVGAMSIQYARAMGYRVAAIDVGEQKVQYCRELEADVCLNVLDHEDIQAAVPAAIGESGVAAALVTAGSAKAYQAGLEILGPFGTLVCVGIPPPTDQIHFHPLQFIDKGIRIIGSMVGSRGDIVEAIRFVQNGKVVPRVKVIELEELPGLMPIISSSEVSDRSKFLLLCDSNKAKLRRQRNL